MDLALRDAVAIVTGGSRGIGLATGRVLANEGAKVALVARDRQKLDAAVTKHFSPDLEVKVFTADTSDDDDVAAVVEQVADELGPPTVLVNTAANPAPPLLGDIPESQLLTEIDVKVVGYLRCCRAVAPHMIERGWGRVVNVGGLWARTTGCLVGTVRNVGVAALTKNLADELGPQGINVTAVHPGFTVTERAPELIAEFADGMNLSVDMAEQALAKYTSIEQLVTAEQIADVIAFLCSPLSVAINGDAIAVGGGSPGVVHY